MKKAKSDEDILGGLPEDIEQIIERNLFKVELDAPILDVVKAMAERKIGSALVQDKEGKIVGIFSERDLVTKVIPQQLSIRRTQMRQVMSSPLITTPIKTRPAPALKIMLTRNIRHLLVTNEKGKIIGMIGMRKLMEFIVRCLAVSNQQLRERLGPIEELSALAAEE